MRKFLHSRLPERLAHRLPAPLVELAIGLAAAGAFLMIRMVLIPLGGDRAPYAFVFVGIVIATVVAGWRSGLVALIVGQALSWWFVAVRPLTVGSAHGDRVGGLIIATVSELITLLIVALYQREIDNGIREGERRMALLDEARREIDHRVKNNYQTVLSLVELQAARSTDAAVRDALRQVADRIAAISIATDHLTVRGEDPSTVRLRDHLCGLCAQLERGLARGDVHVQCEVADVVAGADTAIHIALIVNELVTNALKHAFTDGRKGIVRVQSKAVDGGLDLEVSDNGCGMDGESPSAGTGLGQRLVENFARHLGATHDVSSSNEGTIHRLHVPELA